MEQCQKKRNKLPKNTKVKYLIANWDILNISAEILDVVSCVIPDKKQKKMFFVGLNLTKYFQRPYEHSNKFCKTKEYAPAKRVMTLSSHGQF